MNARLNAWEWQFAALALLSGAAGVQVTIWLWGPRNALLAAGALHGGTILALATWAAWQQRTGDDDAPADGGDFWPPLLFGAAAILGPVGAFGALLGWAMHRRYRRDATPFESWYQELFPEQREGLAERLYDELAGRMDSSGRQAQVVPFMDVIAHGSRAQKQIAIGLMSRHYQPAFAPALRSALGDPVNSVRIQAATAVAGIENRFLEEALELRRRIERGAGANALLALGRHFDRYAYTGLLDPDREQRNRQQAIETYERYLGLVPDDIDARVAVGRLLLRDGDPAGALGWLEVTRERFGHSARLDAWYMEALYRLGRYGDLREVAAAAAASAEDLPGFLRETAEFWAARDSRSAPAAS